MRGSPRAYRAGPSAWPVITGRWAGRGSGAQGWGPKIVSAKRLETILGCPWRWRGQPGQCAAFRPGAVDLSSGDWHTWRDDRPGQLAERMTHGALRRGALRSGAGHRRGGSGPRPVRSRARGSGPGCPATCGESPQHPSPPRRVTPPARSRSPCTSRASSRVAARGRQARRAEGAPLKP